MEAWAMEIEWWLRTFLELPKGIPDKDTFRRLFERLEPSVVLESLNAWLEPEQQSRPVGAGTNRNCYQPFPSAGLRQPPGQHDGEVRENRIQGGIQEGRIG
ncbi:MAG: transposase family protein [Treponema sp.]|jgi:hypothetical protein|nr:transposase family protein [Treponema sp.]